MAADPVEEAADRLYGVPFDEFVAERTAAAKALRSAGERDAAARVAKLPKPSQVAWVANQLAREGAEELLEAGETLREAQLGGGGREAVREAAAAERDAVEALLRRAAELRPLSRDAVDRLRALLHAVAGDEEVREAFAAGRLVSEPDPGGGWPGLGGFVAPASTPSPRERAKVGGGRKAATKVERGEPAPTKRERDEARKRREARERQAAERREREAARRREEAERRKLERRLKAARDRASAARERLEAARDAYESACDEVARIEEQLA